MKRFTLVINIFFAFNITAQNLDSELKRDAKDSNNLSKLNTESDFYIIGLPDTQYYTENGGGSGSGQGSGSIETFNAQTKWIADNYSDSNIVFVAHLGDCVQNGDEVEEEWIRADTVMQKLENVAGLTDGIPFGIAVGNHDQTPFDDPNGTTDLYNQYFGISRFAGRSYYAGHFYPDNNDDHFSLFNVGSLKFIVVFLEYGAYRDTDGEPLYWADSLLSAYADRFAIIVSHKILEGNDGTNVNFSGQGQAIFDALKNNANLFLMLCGHYTNEGRRVEQNSAGKDVHILLSDYQGETNGGDGWMRLMKFSPSRNKIIVSTFSPSRNNGNGEFRTGSNSQFSLNYLFDDPFPVELANLYGNFDGSNVTLFWNTATEINSFGFEIYRAINNSNWVKIGFISGGGNSSTPKEYNYIDNKIFNSGTYYYKLKQIDNDGFSEYSKIIKVDIISPKQFILKQNYPNPFNATTKIGYSIPSDCFVNISIFDVVGKEIKSLVSGFQHKGKYEVVFDGSHLASGSYFYRIVASNSESPIFVQTKSLVLLK